MFCFWLLLLVVSCAPVVESEFPPPVTGRAAVEPLAPRADPPTDPPMVPAAVPAGSPQALRVTLSGITFEGVAFDSRTHRLQVVDQQGAPGSRFSSAADAARPLNGLAAVNGGFFTPEGEPLGLVIASGSRFGSWNTASSLGSGIWHADKAGNSAISRRESLGRSRATAMRDLLQAGPMLVENGRAVAGLESTKPRMRTLMLWDGGDRWWIGCATPCTLARAGEVLASSSPAGWPVRQALNLDGGRSSELWIAKRVAGGPASIRPAWHRPVRNVLVLVPAQ